MFYLLKETVKPLWLLASNADYRTFVFLMERYGKTPRFREISLRAGGFRLKVPDAASFLWQYKQIFADKIYRFKTVADRPVIIDCGANIGISCLYFTRAHPAARLYAFEADPSIASYLRYNLAENGVDSVDIQQVAVWTYDGQCQFGVQGADAGTVLLPKSHTIDVPCMDLRHFLVQFERIDFLKLDIEGAESRVVPHCEDVLDRVQSLFIEYHQLRGDRPQLAELLSVLQRQQFTYFLAPDLTGGRGYNAVCPDDDILFQVNIGAWRRP